MNKEEIFAESGTNGLYIGIDKSVPALPKSRDTEALIANLVQIVLRNNKILENQTELNNNATYSSTRFNPA
jgi:hypothetical protein